jgi:hypothetical protein
VLSETNNALESTTDSRPVHPSDFPFWVLSPYDLFDANLQRPFRRALVSVGLGILGYFVGLAIAIWGGIEPLFISSWPIYFLALSIVFFFGRARWLQYDIVKRFNSAQETFLVPSAVYFDGLRRIGRRASFLPASIGLTLCALGLGWAAVGITFWSPESYLGSALKALEPPTFPAEWFTGPNLLAKMLIIDWFLLIAVLIGVSFVYGTLMIVLSLPEQVGNWPVIPIPALVLLRLRPVGNYFVIGALYYALTILDIVIIYGARVDVGSLALVSTLVLVGVSCVIVPPIVIQQLVNRARDQLATSIHAKYVGQIYPVASGNTATEGSDGDMSSYSELLKLQELMHSANDTSGWIYQLDILLAGVLSQGIPYLAFLATTLLPNLLNH